LPAELDVKLVQADLTRMPFPDRCFDAILCSGVLDTMPEPSLALREFRRILRDNGRLLLILRGNGAILSAGVEKVFRLSITAFGFLTHRSDRIGPEARLWSRTPVGPQLNTLAETAGLRVAELASGRLVTHAVLVPEG
jgi:ubiquinone/menaquinone biosynthesis C-methylase UbiE